MSIHPMSKKEIEALNECDYWLLQKLEDLVRINGIVIVTRCVLTVGAVYGDLGKVKYVEDMNRRAIAMAEELEKDSRDDLPRAIAVALDYEEEITA